jgi:hypothetical protein
MEKRVRGWVFETANNPPKTIFYIFTIHMTTIS